MEKIFRIQAQINRLQIAISEQAARFSCISHVTAPRYQAMIRTECDSLNKKRNLLQGLFAELEREVVSIKPTT